MLPHAHTHIFEATWIYVMSKKKEKKNVYSLVSTSQPSVLNLWDPHEKKMVHFRKSIFKRNKFKPINETKFDHQDIAIF